MLHFQGAGNKAAERPAGCGEQGRHEGGRQNAGHRWRFRQQPRHEVPPQKGLS